MLSRLRNRRSLAGLPVLLQQALPGQTGRAELHSVEHHLAHLASAFYVCPFDQAVVVSIDGFGDFSSGHGIRMRHRVLWPSLFPTLARDLLSGAHSIPWVSALRR